MTRAVVLCVKTVPYRWFPIAIKWNEHREWSEGRKRPRKILLSKAIVRGESITKHWFNLIWWQRVQRVHCMCESKQSNCMYFVATTSIRQQNINKKRFLIRLPICKTQRDAQRSLSVQKIYSFRSVRVPLFLCVFVAKMRMEMEEMRTANGEWGHRDTPSARNNKWKIEGMATIACITWLWNCIYEGKPRVVADGEWMNGGLHSSRSAAHTHTHTEPDIYLLLLWMSPFHTVLQPDKRNDSIESNWERATNKKNNTNTERNAEAKRATIKIKGKCATHNDTLTRSTDRENRRAYRGVHNSKWTIEKNVSWNEIRLLFLFSFSRLCICCCLGFRFWHRCGDHQDDWSENT